MIEPKNSILCCVIYLYNTHFKDTVSTYKLELYSFLEQQMNTL